MGVQRRVRRRFAGPNGQATRIDSSQGVRQGDPLGPLLFSLAIRPFLEDLSKCIGSEHSLFAYLDDIFILSTNDFLRRFPFSATRPLHLNEGKCTQISLEDVKSHGFEMLGTCIGASNRRSAFLSKKSPDR